ncbi:hypothetical protein [Antrihabitans spumae]|uniref:Lipoprotein n=1 Tax=Antrihabitans spumae TaxID=3373370 RepID=A0ABW7JJG3_9NOCA
MAPKSHLKTAAALTTTAAAVTVAFLLPACSNDEPNTPTITTTAPLSGPDTTVADNPEAAATEQALAAVTRYFQVLSRLDADATTSIADADAVAAGAVLETLKADVTVRRSKGLVITGDVTVLSAKAGDPHIPPPTPAKVEVRACVDTSTRDARFPDGTSAIDSNRLKQQLAILTVENQSWPDSAGWRVTVDAGNRGQERCDAQ